MCIEPRASCASNPVPHVHRTPCHVHRTPCLSASNPVPQCIEPRAGLPNKAWSVDNSGAFSVHLTPCLSLVRQDQDTTHSHGVAVDVKAPQEVSRDKLSQCSMALPLEAGWLGVLATSDSLQES